MEYNQKHYFREHGDATVDGFTIVETSEDQYRVAEQWERNDEPMWADYWIDESELLDRIERDVVEPVGEISDDQFDKLCKVADISFREEITA